MSRISWEFRTWLHDLLIRWAIAVQPPEESKLEALLRRGQERFNQPEGKR